jgi:hypothetical protein
MGCVVHITIVCAGLAASACGATTEPEPCVPIVLSSPGPLVLGHRELDDLGACDRCHVDSSAAVDGNKCLTCHDTVGQRMFQGKGFHSSAIVRGKPCETCHADHKGRGYDPMGWRSMRGGRDGFDHDQTGWPLDGKHLTIDCSDCHTKRDSQGLQTFIGTTRLCGDCHASPHGFTQPALQACDRCHSANVWKPSLSPSNTKFDHNDRRDARMPTIGVHADLACRSCHPNRLFNLGLDRPERCDHCHASPHGGHLFAPLDCAWCHSPTFKTFSARAFDHTERTRFDLGGHKNLPCERCHARALGMTKPSMACESCHAARSPHATRFDALGRPPPCGKCHVASIGAPSQWRLANFDHRKNTKFPLVGKHADIACRACHRGTGPTSFEVLDASKGCLGCHAHSTVHENKYKNDDCLKCHRLPY